MESATVAYGVALASIAATLDWKPGDRLVTFEAEYGANAVNETT